MDIKSGESWGANVFFKFQVMSKSMQQLTAIKNPQVWSLHLSVKPLCIKLYPITSDICRREAWESLILSKIYIIVQKSKNLLSL